MLAYEDEKTTFNLLNIFLRKSVLVVVSVIMAFMGQCFYQNFFQASKYIPDICVIRAVQKIVWASGCGTVQLVFSSNEEISKIYEKVNIQLQFVNCFSFLGFVDYAYYLRKHYKCNNLNRKREYITVTDSKSLVSKSLKLVGRDRQFKK